MHELEHTRVVEALLRPPLFLGVPRWLLTAELALCGGLVFGAGLHAATAIVVLSVALGVHPAAARLCRDDPWAVDILRAYLCRPVVLDGVARLRAPRQRPMRAGRG